MRASRKLVAHVTIYDEHNGVVAHEVRPVEHEQTLNGDVAELVKAGFLDARDAADLPDPDTTARGEVGAGG